MRKSSILIITAIVLVGIGAAALSLNESLRAEPLKAVLHPFINGKNPEQSLVANALLDNYLEQRRTAALWSGLYWGFAWFSAILSALAGLVLKLESFLTDEKIKKDLAAALSVVAALLITISTSGDFQRKWQSTRAAAADIERAAYEFVQANGNEPLVFLGKVGDALHKRHQAILGTGERKEQPALSHVTPAKVE